MPYKHHFPMPARRAQQPVTGAQTPGGAQTQPLAPDLLSATADTLERAAQDLRAVAQAWRDTRALAAQTGDHRAATLAVTDLMQRAGAAVGHVTEALRQIAESTPPPEARMTPAHVWRVAAASTPERRQEG